VLQAAWKDAGEAFRWLNRADWPFQAVGALLLLAVVLFLFDAGLRGRGEMPRLSTSPTPR